MKKEASLQYELGTIRVLAKNLQPVIKTKTGWGKTNFSTENIEKVVKIFKAHNNEKILIDTKEPQFLKGFLTKENQVRGARINVLPDGKVLDKAYSLFSPQLTIHDEKSNNHWDVIYQNPNGNFAYLYTLDKKKNSQKNKYKKVDDFDKHLPTLIKKLQVAIKNGELLALPLYTLIKTKMRVGNEMYFKADGHKGLTTLTKKDIFIRPPHITFKFLAKDGVPQEITKDFPPEYINHLKQKLSSLKQKDFVFTNENGHPLKDTEFEVAFEKYCGEKFYPHIVRSHFATMTARDFLEKNSTATKEQVRELYKSIAEELGHKKFSKKNNDWEISYTVTIHHYIQPDLVEKINSLIK